MRYQDPIRRMPSSDKANIAIQFDGQNCRLRSLAQVFTDLFNIRAGHLQNLQASDSLKEVLP